MATILTTVKERPASSCRPRAARLRLALGMTVTTLMNSTGTAAAEWRISPGLDVRERYSDNVRLGPSGSERSDFITELTPSISVTGDGPGLKLRGRYGLQYFYYANDNEENRTVHQLDAAANAELADDLLFVDGAAAIFQENISPLGAQPIDNHNITDNRRSVKTFTVSPYLRNRFGSTAASVVRYTHASVRENRGDLPNARTDGVLLSLNSGPAFRTLGWSLHHNRQRFNADNTQAVDSATTTANLRYRVSPQFDLTAIGGYDKYDYISTGPEPNGRFYMGGFSWRPTTRTSLTANAGRRFWGKTYLVDTSVRSRHSLWRLSYNEDVTTTQNQFAVQATNNTSDFLNQLFLSSIPDPVLRQQAVDRFILSTGLPPFLSRSVNFFTRQFFLQKSLQASVAIAGAKNTVVFNLFNTTRLAQTAIDPILGVNGRAFNGNTKETGLGALWNWRVTALTSASLTAGYSRITEETTNIRQNQRHIKAAIAKQFRPKLNGGLELWRHARTSDLPSADYVENVVAVYLSMKF